MNRLLYLDYDTDKANFVNHLVSRIAIIVSGH